MSDTAPAKERLDAATCSPDCDAQRKLEEAIQELEWERNTRKNLQHVIVSSWSCESIGKCIDAIREIERGIGPLGPINDWALARILSAHLQQPAELIINDLRKQIEELKANNKDG
jgi:hypothetical protein